MTAPVVHLLHGIHTSSKSRRLADLAPYVEQASGLKVVYHEYGDIWAIQTRYKNPRIAAELLPQIAPGDVLVGHSNGNPIWIRALMMGAPAQGMVLLNAALRDDLPLPPQLKWAHIYYNDDDEAVPWAARLPKWLLDPLWGDMGRDGYRLNDPRVAQTDCEHAMGMPSLLGHSAIITPADCYPWAKLWGSRIGDSAR